MKSFMFSVRGLQSALVMAALSCSSVANAQEIDGDAAYALAKKNNCTKCHAIEKAKKAPPYARIGSKYKGNPDAESILHKHLTGTPNVKTDDSNEVHEPPVVKDQAELTNLIRWILSLSEK